MEVVPRRTASSLMDALGLGAKGDHVYERVRAQSGRELHSVAAALRRTPQELLTELDALVDYGIVRVEDGRVFVDSPSEAVVRVLTETADGAARAHERLSDMAAAIPLLAGRTAGPQPHEVQDVQPLDGEVTRGGQPVQLVQALIAQSGGEIRWLRPDQFRRTREDAMVEVVREAVEAGRRSRAIYPVRALAEARETLVNRASVGEEVRVLPDLPTRMFIVGTTHAVLPEPLGFVDEPRSLVRQRGLVEALICWFEELWDRALPVPDLERGDGRIDLRKLLLQQLAEGAQDEQIARRLGVSLRTVRRRVADLLSELGVDTRFQAGAEAVRRGWL